MSVPTPDETILGLLSVETRHGYDLLEHFRETAELGRVWTLSTSQLYAVLKRLERQGLISGEERAVPGAPPRVEYSVTAAGQERLQAWLFEREPSASMRRVRVEFMSRLYVARLLGLPADEIIANQRQACRVQLARTRSARKATASPVEGMVLDFVIGQLEAAIKWLEHADESTLRVSG